MIPKIIHYSWISSDEKPELVQQCMASWKKYLPDYDVILWDAERIRQEIKSEYVEEAIANKKWAFAADYVRIYAVNKYGGIWLDSDVEVKRSLDGFLSASKLFIGQEAALFFADENAYRNTHLTAHCFGAEPAHPFLERCLQYFAGRHFVTSVDKSLPDSLRLDQRLLPSVMSQLASVMGYDMRGIAYNRKQVIGANEMHVYPSWYFDAPKKPWQKDVYCIHHCMMSWGKNSTPRPREVGTWRQWLANGVMNVLNYVPRKFGMELAVTFLRW